LILVEEQFRLSSLDRLGDEMYGIEETLRDSADSFSRFAELQLVAVAKRLANSRARAEVARSKFTVRYRFGLLARPGNFELL